MSASRTSSSRERAEREQALRQREQLLDQITSYTGTSWLSQAPQSYTDPVTGLRVPITQAPSWSATTTSSGTALSSFGPSAQATAMSVQEAQMNHAEMRREYELMRQDQERYRRLVMEQFVTIPIDYTLGANPATRPAAIKKKVTPVPLSELIADLKTSGAERIEQFL